MNNKKDQPTEATSKNEADAAPCASVCSTVRCRRCVGTGRINTFTPDFAGQVACKYCEGTGRLAKDDPRSSNPADATKHMNNAIQCVISEFLLHPVGSLPPSTCMRIQSLIGQARDLLHSIQDQ